MFFLLRLRLRLRLRLIPVILAFFFAVARTQRWMDGWMDR